MEFDPYGHVQACCVNALYPIGSVLESSLDEIWNGERARKLRDAIRQGDLSKGCMVCRYRTSFVDGERHYDYYNQFQPASDDPQWPKLLAFSLHNTCNLACVMCGADLSSKIRATRSTLEPLPHVYGDSFFDQLRPYLANCSRVDFAGGEPFLVREHRRVWEMIGELDQQPIISITTNGTIWNDYVERLLDRFDINLCVSIDGVTAQTFESIRRGTVYSTFLDHLDRFRAYSKSRGTELFLSFCLLDRNWFEFPALLRAAEGWGLPVNVQTVSDSPTGVQHLPTAELEHVVRLLERNDKDLRELLTRNLGVWDHELNRLRVELDDRRTETIRPPLMKPPSTDNSLAVQRRVLRYATSPHSSSKLESIATDELIEWSDGRSCGSFMVTPGGTLRDVKLDQVEPWATRGAADVTGSTVAEALVLIEQALGGRLWLGDEVEENGRIIHTLWFGLGGVNRDKRGLIHRWICESTSNGARVYVAWDDTLLPPASEGRVSVRTRTVRAT